MTSTDVARHSGVSRATVSYVLNGTPNQTIPDETRRRVLDAAQQLGYTPYAPARALRSGRSDVILFLIPEWPIGPSIASLVEHLSRALAEQGLTLVVHAHPRSARPVSELWKALAPAAVINHQVLTGAEADAADSAGMPVVTPMFHADNGAGGAGFAGFQQGIGRLQATHLATAGHRRLGYAVPDDDRLLAFARPRLAGVRAVCRELRLGAPAVRTVGLRVPAAALAVDGWRRGRPPVTGICAYNDEVALAVLAGMRLRQLSAPADLSVVGVDDIPAGALTDPALSTVATGMSAIGRHLAEAVVCRLAGRPAPPGPGPDILHLVSRET